MAAQRRRAEPSAQRPGPAGGGARPAGGELAVVRARLREVIGPVVERAGYDLEELAVSRVGRKHLVRVVVDGDDGVSLEAVAELSRQISPALDAAEEAAGDFMSNEYRLEVSSPGVDRPLTEPRHWRRNTGRLVRVGVDGHPVVGRVVAADATGVVLDVDGTPRQVAYDRMGPARVQIEFTHPTDDEEGEDER